MDSDGPTDPDTDDEDYEVVEAWTSDGTGLAFDGRVVEYFPAQGPSTRVHIRHIDLRVEEGTAGSAEITLGGPDRQTFAVSALDLPAFEEIIGTINATRDLIGSDPGLDHW